MKVEKKKQVKELANKTAENNILKFEKGQDKLKFDEVSLKNEKLMKRLAQVESLLAKHEKKSK